RKRPLRARTDELKQLDQLNLICCMLRAPLRCFSWSFLTLGVHILFASYQPQLVEKLRLAKVIRMHEEHDALSRRDQRVEVFWPPAMFPEVVVRLPRNVGHSEFGDLPLGVAKKYRWRLGLGGPGRPNSLFAALPFGADAVEV